MAPLATVSPRAGTGSPGLSRWAARTLVAFSVVAIAAIGLDPDLANAADFRSVAEAGGTLYDAPSAKARPLFVASRGLPVEVIASDGTWVKVRDPAGDLAWIEARALSKRRTLVVTVRVLEVRERADEQSGVVARMGEGVLLDLLEQAETRPGWLQVRHRDGAAGFVRISQVWGG